MKTHFGPFAFDPSNQLLWRGGQEVPLPPRVVGVLGLLVARPGEVVSRQELIDAVWKDAFVSDTSLAEAISFLRQALGDDPQQPSYIQTVHRRGYRFLPPVNGAGAAAAPDAAARAVRDPWAQLLPWAIAIVLGAMAAAAVWRVAHPDAPLVPPIARFDVLLPGGATLDGSAPAIAFSPSGARLAAAACDAGGRCQLLVRALDRLDMQPLAGTEGAAAPFFSPDDASIAFFADGKLKTIPLAGGAAETIADAPHALGGAWLDDGSIVFASALAGGLQRVPAAGGRVRAATRVDPAAGELRHETPEAVPGTRAVLATAVLAPSLPPRTRIVALSLDTGQHTIVVDRGASPRFVAPNTITFVRDGDLMAAAFDPSQLKIVGQPVVVAPRVGDAPSEYAVSRAGALATAVGQDDAPAFALAWAARNEAVEPLPRALQNLAAPQPSLDGRRIAAVKSADEPAELWWADVERGTLSRLTFDGEHRDPRWAPGGDAIVFASRAGGVFNLFTRGLDDRSAPRRLTTSPHHQAPGGVSRDGLVVFVDFDPASGADLWSVPLAGGAPQPILRTPFDEEAPAIAPAGRWLAYQSNESNRWEVYVRPFGGGAAMPISAGGGTSPVWSSDGTTLYYAGRAGVMAVTLADCAVAAAALSDRACRDAAPSAPVEILRGAWIPRGARPGGRLLVERARGRLAGVDRIRVTLQWTRELQRVVPPAVVASPK